MRKTLSLAGVLAAVSATPAFAQPPAENPPACAPSKGVDYICGQHGAEDLLRVPGKDWVIASWIGGGIGATSTRDRHTETLYPAPDVSEKQDKIRFPDCPGAPDAKQKEHFTTAGIGIRPGKNGLHTLYATHFGWQRGVDVFDLDTRGSTPHLSWVGCVMSPPDVGVDAIVPTEGDSFLITNWLNPGPNMATDRKAMEGGAINGEIWRWSRDRGWQKLPGSQASGPNGIEISADGKTIYYNAWGARKFVRMTRGPKPKITSIPLDFRPDNVRWAPDGSLLIAGQAEENTKTKVIRVDPRSMKVKLIGTLDSIPAWGPGTSALQVGDKIWVPSYRSDRLAVIPAGK